MEPRAITSRAVTIVADETLNQRCRRHAARLRQLAEFLRAKIPDREARNLPVDQLRADISAVLDGADALDELARGTEPEEETRHPK